MQLRIVPLDPTIHDRAVFSCGNVGVDRYLHSTAAQAARYFKAGTFLLLSPDTPQHIIGFYTLAQHGYRDGEVDPETARALKVAGLASIPMILLGQLGIATTYQSKGLGRMLLWDALERAFSVAHEIGAVAVITDPVDSQAQAFFEKYSFCELHRAPFLRLILPMRTIASAIQKRSLSPLVVSA